MAGGVLALVLLGALLHAGWNAIVKSGSDTFLSTVLVAASAALISAAALPYLAQPAPASWPYIGASLLAQLLYHALLAAAYKGADMSLAYPLMRGNAPLLVALASGPLLAERLAPQQWLALACICAGILSLFWTAARASVQPSRRSIVFALLNAAVIASYTVIDGAGVRRSGAPLSYTMWIFALNGTGMLFWTLRHRAAALALRHYGKRHWRLGAAGGAGTLGSYGLALWAMTQAPVAAIAALRETSILFALAIAAVFLKEKIGPARYAAIALIAGGAVLMRFA